MTRAVQPLYMYYQHLLKYEERPSWDKMLLHLRRKRAGTRPLDECLSRMQAPRSTTAQHSNAYR
jgi:hypothetical protein